MFEERSTGETALWRIPPSTSPPQQGVACNGLTSLEKAGPLNDGTLAPPPQGPLASRVVPPPCARRGPGLPPLDPSPSPLAHIGPFTYRIAPGGRGAFHGTGNRSRNSTATMGNGNNWNSNT